MPLASTLGSPYHSEHLLEAQIIQRLPFASTSFGSLPAEVRDMIYAAAMTIEPVGWGRKPEWLKFPFPANRAGYRSALQASLAFCPGTSAKTRLALLFTCRQIYTEAWHLYYGTEHFAFSKPTPMISLLTEASWASRRELKSVKVDVGNDDLLWQALTYLSQCKHLQRLEVVVGSKWHEGLHLRSDFLHPLRDLAHVDVSVRSQSPRSEILTPLIV